MSDLGATVKLIDEIDGIGYYKVVLNSGDRFYISHEFLETRTDVEWKDYLRLLFHNRNIKWIK